MKSIKILAAVLLFSSQMMGQSVLDDAKKEIANWSEVSQQYFLYCRRVELQNNWQCPLILTSFHQAEDYMEMVCPKDRR